MDRNLSELIAGAVSLFGYDSASCEFQNELQIRTESGTVVSVLISAVEPIALPGVRVGYTTWLNLDPLDVNYLKILRYVSTDIDQVQLVPYQSGTWIVVESVADLRSPLHNQVLPMLSTSVGDPGLKGFDGDKGRVGDPGDPGNRGSTGVLAIPYKLIEDKVVAALTATITIVGLDQIVLAVTTDYPLRVPYLVTLTQGTVTTNTPFGLSVTNVGPGTYWIDADNNLVIDSKPPVAGTTTITLHCDVASPTRIEPFYTSKSIEILTA